MSSHDDIEKLPNKLKAHGRAKAYEDLGDMTGQTYKFGDYKVTVTSGPIVAGPTVTLTVSVDDKTNDDATPPDLNPIVISNPPTLVPDEKGDIPRTDEEGNVTLYRYDPLAALVAMLEDIPGTPWQP